MLYVDPASGSYEGLARADYILITDIHGDHMVPALVDKLRQPTTVILTPKAVAEKVRGCTAISNGETKTIGDFRVEAIPMYNLKPAADGQIYHDKGRGNGYILTYGGLRIYLSGDTEVTPEMKALQNIDIAFLPMNLPFTMTPAMVADAARAFKPKVLYPYHFGETDTSTLTDLLKDTPEVEVRIRKMK